MLWAASGLMFAWLDHDAVDAAGSVRAVEPAVLSSTMLKTDPATWVGDYRPDRIFTTFARPCLRIAGSGASSCRDRVELRSVEDGARVNVDEAWLRRLALERYAGGGRLITATLQTEPDIASRASGPVWQAQFEDPQRTALYFAADDGHFIAARTATWRLYDFFWMLHTMDYVGRDNFNNPLIIAIGMAALWLSISGILLLIRSFR